MLINISNIIVFIFIICIREPRFLRIQRDFLRGVVVVVFVVVFVVVGGVGVGVGGGDGWSARGTSAAASSSWTGCSD